MGVGAVRHDFRRLRVMSLWCSCSSSALFLQTRWFFVCSCLVSFRYDDIYYYSILNYVALFSFFGKGVWWCSYEMSAMFFCTVPYGSYNMLGSPFSIPLPTSIFKADSFFLRAQEYLIKRKQKQEKERRYT